MKQVPRVSAIASFVVDEQNQQNHIAHEALFQRTGNSECYNGIDYGGKKDTDLYGTSILYSSPSYSRIMSRRHCGCRGLLVGKRVQEV